jgi:hypothetical protein
MSGSENAAWELRHLGRIHRASDFNQLLRWAREFRIAEEDSIRKAGTDNWQPVTANPEISAILDPGNRWMVRMAGEEYFAPTFETVVRWSEEGRITEDAVIEGPRTPPGGIKASALPALAGNLRKPRSLKGVLPVLQIDGRDYPASDTDVIRSWIRESRVPVDALIAMNGTDYEPISSCGLFDLEDWPAAAHGTVEEESQPEPPDTPTEAVPPSLQVEPDASPPPSDELDVGERFTAGDHTEAPFTVLTGDSEITVESAARLRKLVKERRIFGYDQLTHPSIGGDGISVGEYLDSQRSGRRWLWLLFILPVAAAAFAALEHFGVTDFVQWL